MSFKPRPTSYKGTLMRTRTEALFAQHCDHVGLEWEYEPLCFGDGSGQYLPDFRITGRNEVVYVEVKAQRESADEWIEGPMRIIWGSEPNARLIAAYPHRGKYETVWSTLTADQGTWKTLARQLPAAYTTGDTFWSYEIDPPRHHVRVDLIDNDSFEEAWARHGARNAPEPPRVSRPWPKWLGPELPECGDEVDGNRWVSARSPEDMWIARFIEVNDTPEVTDNYYTHPIVMSDVASKFMWLGTLAHPYHDAKSIPPSPKWPDVA